MQSKTVDELRALAKSRGLKGYSKLRKDELVALLGAKRTAKKPAAAKAAKSKPAPRGARIHETARPAAAPASAARRHPVASTPAEKARIGHAVEAAQATAAIPASATTRAAQPTARTEPAAETYTNPPWPPAWWQPPAGPPPHDAESAKYAIGAAVAEPANDLGEDIERLPPLRGPMLMLLPQKPGILHAYWSLGAGSDAGALRLRLCRVVGGLTEVLSEIALPAARGNFYFHLATDLSPGDALVQLGEYRDGVFVSLMQRGLPRLPLRHAAPSFWLSAALFRRRFAETALGSSGAFLSNPEVISSR